MPPLSTAKGFRVFPLVGIGAGAEASRGASFINGEVIQRFSPGQHRCQCWGIQGCLLYQRQRDSECFPWLAEVPPLSMAKGFRVFPLVGIGAGTEASRGTSFINGEGIPSVSFGRHRCRCSLPQQKSFPKCQVSGFWWWRLRSAVTIGG